MPAQNRVSPESQILAIPLRGRFMGNRGCLHQGTSIFRPWNGRRWLICELDFRGRRVAQWNPGRYTVLFFYDEAVALAAGHRPCAECRHDRYVAYRGAWEAAHGGGRASADVMDLRLHQERVEGRVQRQHHVAWSALPDGAFVLHDGRPALLWDGGLIPWTAEGYQSPIARPTGESALVLTPPATLAVLHAGYRPEIWPPEGT